jgi:hypothetical protein
MGALCFTCHEELKARIDAAQFIHQPVKDSSCDSCHLPHSSRYVHRIFAESPVGSYSPYDPARYALCFSCHEQEITEERYTEMFTDFRNGALNLHYLHVNRDVDGRTCFTCHDVHTSNRPKLIRDETSYGSWRAPIRFIKTETGGSCSPGCHEEFGYDRVSPLQLKAE